MPIQPNDITLEIFPVSLSGVTELISWKGLNSVMTLKPDTVPDG